MIIDKIFYPITSLGPGKRLGIWTQGCSKRCKNCIAPELWYPDPEKNVTVPNLLEAIRSAFDDVKPDGITVSGGDPLEQPEELLELVRGLSGYSDDILLYTGYEFEELEGILGKDYINELKKYVAVLIDGRYIDEKNDGKTALRGSTNQKIIFFKNEMKEKYAPLLKEERCLQNVFFGNAIMSVGIHRKDKED